MRGTRIVAGAVRLEFPDIVRVFQLRLAMIGGVGLAGIILAGIAIPRWWPLRPVPLPPGSADWSLQHPRAKDARLEVWRDVYQVTIYKLDSKKPVELWRLFPRQVLGPGRSAMIRFQARAETQRVLPIVLRTYGGRGTVLWQGSVLASPRWTQYQLRATLSTPLPETTRMSFPLTAACGEVDLTDIQLSRS